MKLLSGYVLNLDRRGAIVDALTELRRTDPVHWQPMAGEPGSWAVLRHADVAHVDRHPEIFLLPRNT